MAAVLRLPATIRSMTDYDATWYMWTSFVWTNLECGLGIIIACMPSLTPLVMRRPPGGGTKAESNARIDEERPRTLQSWPLENISASEMWVAGSGDSVDEILADERDPWKDEGIKKTTVISQKV